jgi:hypothetical protein
MESLQSRLADQLCLYFLTPKEIYEAMRVIRLCVLFGYLLNPKNLTNSPAMVELALGKSAKSP